MRPLPFSLEEAAALLGDSDTFATVLHIIILSAYGEEVYGDPENDIPPMDILEIIARLEEDFRTSIPVENENRINAIRLAVSTDAFYEEPEAMAAIASSLYNGDLDDIVNGFLEDVTIPEILWATYEVELNREEPSEFSPACLRFIEKQIEEEREEHIDESVDTLPEILPYHAKFVNAQKAMLETQLAKLGISLPSSSATA
jgi:hypothetical protein